MKSFSSAINKTGKKFAPKAPARRPPAAPARRPSAAQQSPAETSQTKPTSESSAKNDSPSLAPQVTAEAEKPAVAASPAPSAAGAGSTPIPPTTTTTQAAFSTPTTSSQTNETPKPTAISRPTLTPRTPISKPTSIPKPNAIPKPDSVPVSQKRKAEAVPQPEPTTSAPPTPPSTQQTPPTAKLNSESQTAEGQGPEQALLDYARAEAARAAGDLVESSATQQHPPTPKDTPKDTRVEAPPAKRTKKAVPTPTAKPSRRKSTSASSSTAASRRGSQSVVPTIEDPNQNASGSNLTTPDPATKPKKRKYSKTEASDPEGNERPKRNRKKREPTPEDAEGVEILPNVMKMSELCKDLRTGKKSKREVELRKMDQEEEERKKQGGGTPVKEPEPEKEEQPVNWKPQSGPKMRVVNGEIVLDNTSLQVDRHADAAREAGELEDVEESSFTRKINQATYGKRSKTETWDETMTDLFYRGLRMFGTDFMVISKMFPGRSRRQIKLKFNNEERRDPQRIKDTLLGPRETITIAAYSEMTNTVYDDPKAVQQELDEEKKRIEDQHAKEQELQQELLRNPTEPKDEKNDKGTAKKTRKKQVKDNGGGTEEVLGSIDDFPTA
ncbi:unnamed protein product [Penicillium olsonii]|nr:unnamed protein product [Penicillium olsonii]